MNDSTPTNPRPTRGTRLPTACRVAFWLCIAMAWPRAGLADGMMFQFQGATSQVQAEAQRAVLWLRDGQWELTIYPLFSRQAGRSAWVVPFPVRPVVSEGSADLMDELEAITAPVTVEFCSEPYCCCPGDEWCGTAGGADGEPQWAEPTVNVWERGTVGSLDYVILSSADGDSLVSWLTDNDYGIPAAVTPVLTDLAAQGSYFFAAKLQADVDPEAPLSPVTFALPDLEDPSYPLRLTAPGVGDDELALVLWLITPQDEIYAVADDFAPEIDYHGVLAFHPFVTNPMSCVSLESYDDDYYFFGCVDFASYGYELPATFSAPLQEIIDGHQVVTRYAIALDAGDMAQDMLFEPNESPLLEIHSEAWDGISNIHMEDTGSCYSCPVCPDDADPDGDAGDPDDAGDAYPDPRDDTGAARAEPWPDAGGFPDITSSADAGGEAGTSTPDPSATAAGADDDSNACATVPGAQAPVGLGAILVLLAELLVVRRRRR